MAFIGAALVLVALSFMVYLWFNDRFQRDPVAPKPTSARNRRIPGQLLAGGGVLAILATTGVYLALRSVPTTDHADARLAPGDGAAPSERADAISMQTAANALSGTDSLPGSSSPLKGSDKVQAGSDHAGGSMDAAVAGLERRLAAGGGSDADWDLLAKSYDFLGRRADAAAARQKRLPAGAALGGAAMGNSAASIEMAALPRRAQVSAAAGKLLDEADAARRRHDFAAAREVYAKLVARQEMTADAWADYADVVGTLNGNSLGGEPERYVQNALRRDPQNAKALWLLASLQHARKQYGAAVASWGKLGAVLAPNSDDANLVAANLAQDQALARGAAEPPGPALTATTGAPARNDALESVTAPQSVNNGVAVSGEVVLADSLRSQVPAGLTLFIVAKSVNSPGPPVAILRATTDAWPVRFRLDDSQSMMPQRKLSTAGPVTIEARTSKSGQAMPAPGDFQGVTSALDPAAGKPVRIVIERVIS